MYEEACDGCGKVRNIVWSSYTGHFCRTCANILEKSESRTIRHIRKSHGLKGLPK